MTPQSPAAAHHDVAVHTEGAVSSTDLAYAREKVEHLRRLAPEPVLFARVDLTLAADPARERPALAKGELDVNGRIVRAHVAAATTHEATDLLESRLRQRLERLTQRVAGERRRHRSHDPHVWRHGDLPTHRAAVYPRPADEREIVKHKTFAPCPETPDDAVFDLEMLDHDFFLFRNINTGEDNVVFRAPDAGYELIEPTPSPAANSDAGIEPIRRSRRRPPTVAIDEARHLLDLADSPFLFFLDPDTGRGSVLYRRYDGHYGLITSGDAR
jgi:ribosome-associated translation inhibitor RaiA